MSPRETRSLLERLGVKPSKRLGQNFLIDANIARKSVALAEVTGGETVVEIGPGLGALSRELLAAGAFVFAVEKDLRLFQYLEQMLKPDYPDRFLPVHADALALPAAGLEQPGKRTLKVVANLPYAISTPWLDALLDIAFPDRLVLMLQRETAERFAARPGTKQYGAITIFLEAAYERLRGHPVSRHCFYPEPDVDSVLLHLRRRPDPFRFQPETKTLIRTCFGQRRKQIGSLLRRFGTGYNTTGWLEQLDEAGFSGKSRPEEIPAELWTLLDRHFRNRQS